MAKKAVQVRVPVHLHNDVAIVAAALGKSVPEYVEEELAASVARDLPKAAKIAQDRADASKPKKH